MPRAYEDQTGLVVRFYRADRQFLEEGGDITIDIEGVSGKSVEMHIVEEIGEKIKRIKRSGFLTEPWIRTIAVPFGPPEKRETYKIWLESHAAREMLKNKEGPMGDCFLETRCSYDRLCLSYFDV